VTGATTLALEPSYGSMLSETYEWVTPTQTTTYTLTLNGSITAQVTVTVRPGAFTPTGSMTQPRTRHTATLLPSGQVLIAGGGYRAYDSLASAELYDSSAGTFAPTGSMAVGRQVHTATLLGNGKVLIVGGYDSNHDSLASAELYDPSAGTFAPTGSMSVGRWAHTATLLDNGKVLVAGGCDAGAEILHAASSAELYDPSTGTFAPVGNMTVGRYLHTATSLGNGKVLIAGGFERQVAPVGGEVSSAELYDSAARTFTATASMTSERAGHAATLMNDGRVLITGGSGGGTMTASAELYDPAAGAFAATGDMTDARASHTATLLGNGEVLVAGEGWRTLQGADLYDPVAGVFATTGLMTAARGLHTATLLPSGEVLVAGGSDHDTVFGSAELYDSTRDHL
jgi:hypothetical protein